MDYTASKLLSGPTTSRRRRSKKCGGGGSGLINGNGRAALGSVRWVISVWALIVLACLACHHQVIRPSEAAAQQQAKNDINNRSGTQIPIAHRAATSNEKIAAAKNASLLEMNDDLLAAASSTAASPLASSPSSPIQPRQIVASGTGSGSSRSGGVIVTTAPTTFSSNSAAVTTTTLASAPSSSSTTASTTTESGGKRRPIAAGGAKLGQEKTAVNQQVAAGRGKQKQNANEPQSQRVPAAAGSNAGAEGAELIERMSTSQSVSFADPVMVSANNNNNNNRQQPSAQSHGRQQQQVAEGAPATMATAASNRWTHFGARLKPLGSAQQQQQPQHQRATTMAAPAAAADHYEGAPNSPAYSKVPSSGGQVIARPAQMPVVAKSVQANELNGDDQDEADDDQDNEALLYKMMQQQTFLMSPNWQQQLDSSPSARGHLQQDSQQQHRMPAHQAANPMHIRGGGGGQVVGDKDSKRVMKLLKSYSHIHQVDDSDDQIRGTYTRFASRRQQQDRQQQPLNGKHYASYWQPASGNSESAPGEPPMIRRQSASTTRKPVSVYANVVRHNPLAGTDEDDDDDDNTGNQLLASDGSGNQVAASNGQEVGSAAEAAGSAAPEESEFECPNNGIFADEASGCQSYHVCQAGAQVQEKFQCPLGTLFNNIILTCDFAHNVQCHGPAAKKAAAAAAAGAQEPDSNHQPTWRPAATAAPPQRRVQQSHGPRRLQIGQSRYNQQQLTSVDRAVSAYPPSASSVDSSDAGDDTNDDSSDYSTPMVPLKPAVLPPSRRPPANSADFLPYNPPPRPLADHSMMDEREVATEATPVFADAARTVPTSTAVAVVNTKPNSQYGTTSSQSSPAQVRTIANNQQPQDDQAQNFNLVINHVAPTQVSVQPAAKPQPQSKPAIATSYLVASTNDGGKRLQQAAATSQQQQQVSARQPTLQQQYQQQAPVTSVYVKSKKEQITIAPQRQQQHQPQVTSASQPRQPALSASHAQGRQIVTESGAGNKPVNQRVATYDSQRSQQFQGANSRQPAARTHQVVSQQQQLARQASQFAGQPQQQYQHQHKSEQVSGTKPAVVDLTSDRGHQGVSSEAINEGLVLLLRHGPIQAPATTSHYTPATRSHHQSATNKHQQTQYVAAASNQRQASSTSGVETKALAVAPALIRPDSPIDAQLFPNVQHALAEAQQDSQAGHRQQRQVTSQWTVAAASVQVAQKASPSAAASPSASISNNGVTRTLGVLPPMEPPKPTKLSNSDTSRTQHVGQHNSHGPNKKALAYNQKPPVKKTKKLKASQLPSAASVHPASQQHQPSPEPNSSLSSSPSERLLTRVASTSTPISSPVVTTTLANTTTVSSNKRPQQA